MRVDWYQATVPEKGPSVLGLMGGHKAFDLCDFDRVGARNSYSDAVSVVRGGNQVALVMWGGVNEGANVCFTGPSAPIGREFIREHWPAHRVSRVDSCEDYCEDGAWDVLESLCETIADTHDVKLRHNGDFYRREDGRTLYLGGKTSPVQVRCYEKGRQMRSLGVETADLRWVRAEVQIRPPSRVKGVIGQLSERELWGCAKFSSEFMRLLDSKEVKATPMNEYRPSDDERAYKAMLRQYGPLLRRLAETQGWDMLGRTIGDDLARFDES